jgi:hypothetical protein
MLKAVDILLGVTVVMLVFSAMVTIITQFVINFRNMKGRHLHTGLADLLEQLSPGISREFAEHISEKVLTHPLIRESEKKFGAVVHRDELTKLLLEFADGNGTVTLNDTSARALREVLAKNGIDKPGEVLQNVRSLALQIELANPELSNAMRNNLALLQEANSAFLAKLNGWFDQTMDRVTDRFTLSTRYVTFFVAIGVALAVQLDTVSLVNRLSIDPAARQKVADLAYEINASRQPDTTPATEVPQQALAQLRELNLVDFPDSFGDWIQRWSVDESPLHVFGIILSAILLSLGAPFWYSALTNLLRLRGVLAPKEDKERTERQTMQQPPTAAAAAGAAPGELLRGERGNLGTLG